MDIPNAYSGRGSIMISDGSLSKAIILKSTNVLTNINAWHKFIINNAENVPRETVLRAILDHVHPRDLIPVSYTKNQFGAFFLARNCAAAIEKLCEDNLVVPHPYDDRPFKLTIILKFSTTAELKIDARENILSVLNKRYDPINRILDLTSLDEDPGLKEFCPLSQPKIMIFVLYISKNLTPQPVKYIFKGNRIKLLNPLLCLRGSVSNISLDLSNNLIENMTILKPLKSFNVQELSLDGNPLCEHFQAVDYVNEVEKYCNNLQVLDGIQLKDIKNPKIITNYLCNKDALELVNQFLERYFFTYDSDNRRPIQYLYHKNAMFSINCRHNHGQTTSQNSRVETYGRFLRNLVKRKELCLYKSSEAIAKMLSDFPPTEHDPSSFQVDLMHYDKRSAVLGVSGVFRHRPITPQQVFGFRRIFNLIIDNGDECCIVNEMMHVYNALNWQVEQFSFVKPLRENWRLPKTMAEERQLTDALTIITNLKRNWSRKCLEECSYDLRDALTLFVKLYKLDKFPKDAFVRNNRSLT